MLQQMNGPADMMRNTVYTRRKNLSLLSHYNLDNDKTLCTEVTMLFHVLLLLLQPSLLVKMLWPPKPSFSRDENDALFSYLHEVNTLTRNTSRNGESFFVEMSFLNEQHSHNSPFDLHRTFISIFVQPQASGPLIIASTTLPLPHLHSFEGPKAVDHKTYTWKKGFKELLLILPCALSRPKVDYLL